MSGLIREKTEQIMERIELLGIKADKMAEYSPSVLLRHLNLVIRSIMQE